MAGEVGGRERGKGNNLAQTQVVIIKAYFLIEKKKKPKGLRNAKKMKSKCTRRWLFWQSKVVCNHFQEDARGIASHDVVT